MKNRDDRTVDPEMRYALLACADLALVADQSPPICGRPSPRRRVSVAPVLKRRRLWVDVAPDALELDGLALRNRAERPLSLGAAFWQDPATARLSRRQVDDSVCQRVVASASSAVESDSLD